MTDTTTAVAEAARRLLAPDERVLAGLAAHPVHEPGAHPPEVPLVRTGIGGLVMGEILDCYQAAAQEPLGARAAEVPTRYRFWVGLTTARLLFFEGGLIGRLVPAHEGAPGRLHSEIALSDVVAIAPLDAEGEERLELRFADGSHARVSCAHAGEGGAFRAAFEGARRALVGG